MTIEEFSNEFDVLLTNQLVPRNWNQTPLALDEYEKSIYLTEAQEEIVRELYRGTILGNSFEETEELRRSLDTLVTSAKLIPINGECTLPIDTLFITYESCTLDIDSNCNISDIEVIPVKQDEYHRVKNNPFRGSSKSRILRLDVGNSKVKLDSKYPIANYFIRYIKKPKPILLVDLEDGLSIDGTSTKNGSSLNSSIHRLILMRAVQKAINKLTPSSNT